MSRLPTIGALWIGGALSWLEQLCLKSFAAHGHEVLLFTYGPVRNIPDGVRVCDGREILDTADFLLHEKTQSVALFSDLFRFHMIKSMPEIIYVDTDVFCLKPMNFSNPYLFGFEKHHNEKSWRLNGAVLRLPPESQILSKMLEFMSQTHPMPTWVPGWFKPQMQARFDTGVPMHVSEFPWGVWGPLGITAFARETGEVKHAQNVDVFYPVPFPDRRFLFMRPRKLNAFLTENSVTIHMWAPIKRLAAKRYDGLCPPTSYIGQQLVKHGLDPALAPVPKSHRREVSY
ncbi:hypothetical protein [Yoonia sp.]|uniref:hypothetical protein n=1 Tax=Yoonia sp. TaxID=2212373 RepID=UPI00358E47F6